ncbi:MAG: hypothetical protein QXS93_03780 [Candidatus Micrarchaeia archaeon]
MNSNTVVLLVFIPILIFAIYLMPQQWKEDYLILKISSPNILSIIASNYVHTSLEHLLSNLLVYMAIIISLTLMGEIHRITPQLLFFLFVIVPVIISVTNLLILPLGEAFGFSGISSAFAGLFLYIVCLHMRDFWGVKDILPVLLIILGINTFLLAFTNPQLLESYPLSFMIILAVLVGLIAVNIKSIVTILSYIWKQYLKHAGNPKQYILRSMLFFASAVLVFSLPFIVMLPQPGVFYLVNTVAHYIGYMIGLVVGLFLCK